LFRAGRFGIRRRKTLILLPQGQIFCLYRRSRPKERSQEAKIQLEQVGHQVASLSRSFPASMQNRFFGTHRSWLKALGMKIARHRGMRRAIVAVARRMAVIMHRMWADGTEFHWAKPTAETA